MRIGVDCYAGHRGEETPRRIRLGRRTVDVAEVLDRWISPDHRYFKVLTQDREIMIIRHDVEAWAWELHFYRQEPAPVPDSWWKEAPRGCPSRSLADG